MSDQSLTSRVLQLLMLMIVLSSFNTQSVSAQGITLRLQDGDGEPLQGAVMELLRDATDASASEQMLEAEIDQRDKEFIPAVTAIVAGGSISFPNSDDILHHVYSFSPAKTFDTPLYGSDADSQYRELFDVPGVIEIGCNIHDWMLAYIYIGQSELMAISDDLGIASLTNLPAGQYTLKVWHSRLDAPQNSLEQDLIIEAGRTAELELTLDLLRDRRVRRAPSANRKRYR
ncbi:MAG: methylamine utilization protein [Pseudohongiellaceae bacterium]